MSTVGEIAGWDTRMLGWRCADLVEAVAGARSWVLRADAVSVGLPPAWVGQGRDAATTRLRSWLAVAARVGAGVQILAEDVALAAERYTAAQQAAETALRLAAQEGLQIDPDGTLAMGLPTATQLERMALDQIAVLTDRDSAAIRIRAEIDEALRLARHGDDLLQSALRVFTRQAVPGFGPSAGFADLAAAVSYPGHGLPAPLPLVPTSGTPHAVAAWWSMLTVDVQARLAREQPERIGGLDGVSAWARDLANRIVLDRALRTATGAELAMLLAVRAALDRPDTQLLLLDPQRCRAAIAVGDLDTAGAVAVLVPGTGVTVAPDLPALVGDAATLHAAVPNGHAAAVLAWVGYDTPTLFQAPFPGPAITAGPLLSSALTGLAAARRPDRPRTTVVGHSYGTAVISAAAVQPGRLLAEAVVLLGSPGTLAADAADFEVAPGRVFVADASRDWVADLSRLELEVFGPDPSYQGYGGVCITAAMPDPADSDHFHYYDEDSEALRNTAWIVAGRYAAVESRPCDVEPK